jgi:hypothetical protein
MRISSLLGKITVLFVICCCCLPAQAKYGGGSGTQEDPYLIYTAEQMNAIGADANDWDKCFKLMADIDLSGFDGTEFNIIGYYVSWDDNKPFTGVFDGNGHIISNFTYTSVGTNYIGILGFVKGEIKDLGLIDAIVDGGTGKNVGTIVGGNSGTITNCYSIGSVMGDTVVGGLVGFNLGTITNCYATALVSGTNSVGGLVGRNFETITNCYSNSNVIGEGVVGGLVGGNYSKGIISNCYSSGSVLGYDDVGGLVGLNQYSREFSNSFWDIETSGQANSAGGTGKTTDEMHIASTFTSFGCEPVWTIYEGKDYPRLVWENAPGDPITTPSYGGGSGEPNDPYLIYTAEQLNTIGLVLCHWDKHFKLMADIDLGGYTGTEFNIIGYSVDRWYKMPFTGIFEGNGHTIWNFEYTSTDTDFIGLFGYVSGLNAKIKDLTLCYPNVDGGYARSVGSLVGGMAKGLILDCVITGGEVSGDDYCVGGLIGSLSNDGTVSGCYSSCSVRGRLYIGGLVGNSSGAILGCGCTGIASGKSSVGGLVGRNTGGISNCWTEAKVFGDYEAGGLVGYDSGGTILKSSAFGFVSGNREVGGLVGYAYGTLISYCCTKGDIKGNHETGGLVGYSSYISTISHSFSDVNVSGRKYNGGLVGETSYATISNSYATGRVSGSNWYTGGLIGMNDKSTVSNCYATVVVSSSDISGVGGLVGRNTGDVSASFWDIEISGQDTSDGGTGLPTAEMQTMSTFIDSGWDFVGEAVNGIEDIWFIGQQDYPRLWWEGMKIPMKLTPRTLNCRSEGNWVKAHLTLPEGFTVADVDADRPAVLRDFHFESAPLYVFVNKDKLVEIEAAFERQAICSLAGDWPQELTVAGFLTDGNIFLGTSSVKIIHPGMKVIEELASSWLQGDCVHPTWCDGIDMNRDSLVNLPDYALLMNIEVEFVTDE